MAWFASLLTMLHIAVVVLTTLRILLREDISSSARLAWFIVIVTLPVAGLIVYIALGEIRLPKELRARHAEVMLELREALPEVFGTHERFGLLPHALQKPFRMSSAINGFHPTSGNAAELMADAAETHARMIADIDAAKRSINIFFYIWLADTTGREIAQALMRAAQRGVTVRAAADALGSRKLLRTPLWREMKEAGVDLAIGMPFQSIFGISLITRVDLRNHRKITVIDGSIAYIGSKNAADPAFSPKPRFAPWVDIMLRVRGPVVHQVQALFASERMLSSRLSPAELELNAAPVEGGFVAQYQGTGPLERPMSSSQVFVTLFELSRRELSVTTPYFVPDIAVVSALQAAARRGVDVTLNVPQRNDSWIVKAASRGFYQSLLDAGVKIMEYTPGLLHSKIVTVDRKVVLLGSSNLDLRSFDLNFESDLLFHDRALAGEIRARQQSYLAASVPVTLEEIRARGPLSRLRDNLVATLGPIL